MRVGISLLTLVPGRIGGSETYARSLVRALARVGTLEYTVFESSLSAAAGDGLPVEVVPEYRAWSSDAGRLLAMVGAAARPGPIRTRFKGFDAVHFPLTVPVPPGLAPRAVTVHDVQHLDLPGMFPKAERAFRRLAYDRSARNADAVITISSFCRERILELLDVPPDRVHIVPLGVDHGRFHPDDRERDAFLLYPARRWPHKNHDRLLDAFGRIRRERPDLRLVLTGGGLERLAHAAGVETRGNVASDELVELYRRAACLVFPSLYEGFGLPPLEAMASGCPVAAANTAALPETCGDAAVLFDPTDPASIASGVLEALERADELRAKGFAHAAGFTWDATARGHERVYASLG